MMALINLQVDFGIMCDAISCVMIMMVVWKQLYYLDEYILHFLQSEQIEKERKIYYCRIQMLNKCKSKWWQIKLLQIMM